MTERPGASTSTDLDDTEHGVPADEPAQAPPPAVPGDDRDGVPGDDRDDVPDDVTPGDTPPEDAQPDAGRTEDAGTGPGEAGGSDDAAPTAVVEPPTTPAPMPVVPAPAAPPEDGPADPAAADPTAADPAAAPPAPVHRHLARAEETEERRRRRRRVLRRTGLGTVVVLLVVATAASVWLYRTSEAWEDRAARYETTAEDLGAELAAARSTLAGTEAELDAVRGQLETAKTRIIELADEKQQATDDREAQRQLAAYQDRVNDAAGRVALALDQCVQGQQQLIGYLQAQATAAEADDPAPYDADELEEFRTDVETLCQTATEANIALQQELDR